MEVQIGDPDKTSLIGFFLRDLLRSNLQNKRCEQSARGMRGAILFNASGMQVTLLFQDQTIDICPGEGEKICARIKGEMNDLLDVALGENYLKYLLIGKIRISGNIFKLLRLLKILRRRN